MSKPTFKKPFEPNSSKPNRLLGRRLTTAEMDENGPRGCVSFATKNMNQGMFARQENRYSW